VTGVLPAPSTPAGQAGLSALLSEPAGALLAFDFDGTLAPIVADPARARAHPLAASRLASLSAYVGRIAIVTGRPPLVAVELGGFADQRGLERLTVLGHYGLQRWEAATGEVVAPDPHPGIGVVRRELPAVVARLRDDGVRVEDKGSAIAVHTRNAADPAGAFGALREPLASLAEGVGLAVEPGRFVLELRPRGIDKGAALRGLVAEQAPSAVVFVGDDLGDLAAFDAVDALRAEGLPGLLVCSGSDEVGELAARADLVVDGPDGVMDLLAALELRLSGPSEG
jgi:trehalose 6-phosphate phosphatase